MTLHQQQPHSAVNNLASLKDKIDTAGAGRLGAGGTAELRQEVVPSYGGPQRDAINSVIDGIVGDICGKIEALRKMLDQIEQEVLTSAGKSKHSLSEHVSVCTSINDEILHMREVIAELSERARDA